MTVTVSVSGPSDTSERLQPRASVSGSIITPNEEVESELSDMPETPASTSGQWRFHSCALAVACAKCFLPVRQHRSASAKRCRMVSASACRVNAKWRKVTAGIAAKVLPNSYSKNLADCSTCLST